MIATSVENNAIVTCCIFDIQSNENYNLTGNDHDEATYSH